MNQATDVRNVTISEHISNFSDHFLNFIFSTSNRAGRIRNIFFQILFVLTWIICAFTFHQPGEIDYPWLDFLLSIPFPITKTIVSIIELFLAWDVLLVMVTIYFGYLIAIQFASIYLADIFELKDQSISERYIKQSAFSSTGYYQIQIENAQVKTENQKSPIFRIGGPGKVLVNLENAVVFEKINGMPRIIRPTIDKPIELESFERIRKIIDLRDQTVTLSISARTFDGVSIDLKDIRLIFSVLRSSKNSSLTNPYPFNEESIYWLVYQLGSGPWTTSLVDMVRTELTNFINHHRFSELFSSVGAPEINKQLQNQLKSSKRIRNNWAHVRRYKINRNLYTKLKTNAPQHRPLYFKKTHRKEPRHFRLMSNHIVKESEFIPRKTLSNLFYENISNSFHSKAQKYGLRLEWINVGAWQSSSKIVPDQYISAWKISSENSLKLHPKVLKNIFDQNRNLNLARNIQNLPIVSFIHKHEAEKSRPEIINELINEYTSRLWRARDLYFKKKGRVPIQLERSLIHLRNYQMHLLEGQAYFLGEEEGPIGEDN